MNSQIMIARRHPIRVAPFALATAAAVALVAPGCGSSSPADEKGQVASAMQASMAGDLITLHRASIDLQAAAPTPAGRGWDPAMDAAAITAMKVAWVHARTAYEHVEGATAPIFPEIDVAIDERYDGFLADLKGAGDPNPFDGMGVTGMHAIERILYSQPSDAVPAAVTTFEASLPGYAVAAFPATEEQAAYFKAELCGQLVVDTQRLLDQWTPQEIDVSGAFTGLVGLMNEQKEKVIKASTGEEESRYSQHTMADLRANLEGTEKIYALFSDWLKSKPASATTPGGMTGTMIDAAIKTAFAQLASVYATVVGDAIPAPPPTWSAEAPSPADLQSPFGALYVAVYQAVDPAASGSIVALMNDGAKLLGIFNPEK